MRAYSLKLYFNRGGAIRSGELMSKKARTILPLARKQRLILKELPDELLVYDLDRNTAHCLNDTAATIWNLCDGDSTAAEIAAKLAKQTGRPVDEDLVWLALDQLDRDQLLADRLMLPAQIGRISRRAAVKRIGAAALALPLVYSITAPTAAQTGTCLPRDAPCTSDAECCSGNCRGNGRCA
jgi:Coenzyme PQQ synthesis protein D (PqqD)